MNRPGSPHSLCAEAVVLTHIVCEGLVNPAISLVVLALAACLHLCCVAGGPRPDSFPEAGTATDRLCDKKFITPHRCGDPQSAPSPSVPRAVPGKLPALWAGDGTHTVCQRERLQLSWLGRLQGELLPEGIGARGGELLATCARLVMVYSGEEPDGESRGICGGKSMGIWVDRGINGATHM